MCSIGITVHLKITESMNTTLIEHPFIYMWRLLLSVYNVT